MVTWHTSYRDPAGLNYLEHLGGVPWNEAPLPSRFHRCTPQTRGFFGSSGVQRCACGAIRLRPVDRWSERNSRRRGHARR